MGVQGFESEGLRARLRLDEEMETTTGLLSPVSQALPFTTRQGRTH